MYIFIGVFLLIMAVIVYSFVAKRKREQAMAAYAAQHGWTALDNRAEVLQQYLPRYLQGLGQNGFSFQVGMSRTTESYDMAYQAVIEGHQTVIFQYQYTEYYSTYDAATQQQQEQSTTHYFTVINTTLPVTLPTILLLHHNFISKLATMGDHNGLQAINLEGDFNKYFDMYITPNSQTEALSLLTPDTMELFVNIANGASAQISGESIVLTIENKYLTPQVIEPVLGGISKLFANILNKAQSRLQTPPVQTVEQPVSTP